MRRSFKIPMGAVAIRRVRNIPRGTVAQVRVYSAKGEAIFIVSVAADHLDLHHLALPADAVSVEVETEGPPPLPGFECRVDFDGDRL